MSVVEIEVHFFWGDLKPWCPSSAGSLTGNEEFPKPCWSFWGELWIFYLLVHKLFSFTYYQVDALGFHPALLLLSYLPESSRPHLHLFCLPLASCSVLDVPLVLRFSLLYLCIFNMKSILLHVHIAILAVLCFMLSLYYFTFDSSFIFDCVCWEPIVGPCICQHFSKLGLLSWILFYGLTNYFFSSPITVSPPFLLSFWTLPPASPLPHPSSTLSPFSSEKDSPPMYNNQPWLIKLQ